MTETRALAGRLETPGRFDHQGRTARSGPGDRLQRRRNTTPCRTAALMSATRCTTGVDGGRIRCIRHGGHRPEDRPGDTAAISRSGCSDRSCRRGAVRVNAAGSVTCPTVRSPNFGNGGALTTTRTPGPARRRFRAGAVGQNITGNVSYLTVISDAFIRVVSRRSACVHTN